MAARSAENEFRKALAWLVLILIAGAGLFLLLASIASCVTT